MTTSLCQHVAVIRQDDIFMSTACRHMSRQHLCVSTLPSYVMTTSLCQHDAIRRHDDICVWARYRHTSWRHLCASTLPSYVMTTSLCQHNAVMRHDDISVSARCRHALWRHLCVSRLPSYVMTTSLCQQVAVSLMHTQHKALNASRICWSITSHVSPGVSQSWVLIGNKCEGKILTFLKRGDIFIIFNNYQIKQFNF